MTHGEVRSFSSRLLWTVACQVDQHEPYNTEENVTIPPGLEVLRLSHRHASTISQTKPDASTGPMQ